MPATQGPRDSTYTQILFYFCTFLLMASLGTLTFGSNIGNRCLPAAYLLPGELSCWDRNASHTGLFVYTDWIRVSGPPERPTVRAQGQGESAAHSRGQATLGWAQPLPCDSQEDK